jgi:hypothetical protein
MSEDNWMSFAIILSFGFGFWSSSLVDSIIVRFYILKAQWRNNQELKVKKEELKKMRAMGEFHQWKEMYFTDGSHLVCLKTGWCPTLKGFVDMNRIERYIKAEIMQEEYKAFRAERVNNLASKLVLTIADTEKIVEEIFSMKKDFHLMKTTQLQQELKAKAAHVESQGNKI